MHVACLVIERLLWPSAPQPLLYNELKACRDIHKFASRLMSRDSLEVSIARNTLCTAQSILRWYMNYFAAEK